jgi:glycosyltransferase involved in cell wall biosynthesis
VITSKIGHIPSYLADKQSAILVRPGSVDSIVEALEFVLENEEQALQIGRAGRDIAEKEFDADRNGQMILQIIEDLYAESDR